MINKLKNGSRIYVSFISESRTEFSGKEFKGYGTLDLVEENRVYGKLDNGTPFTCLPTDCKILEDDFSFPLLKKLGLKKARDMLNGYIPAYEDMTELRQQYDAWHLQTVNHARVSPNTVVIN